MEDEANVIEENEPYQVRKDVNYMKESSINCKDLLTLKLLFFYQF